LEERIQITSLYEKKEFSGKYTELMRIKEIICAGNEYNSVVGYIAV
jgi:hypothetical protein